MAVKIRSIQPAPEDLRAIFYSEEPQADPSAGERVVGLAIVDEGAREGVIPMVVDTDDGEIVMADEDKNFLGVAWRDQPEQARALVEAELYRRHPELRPKPQPKETTK